MASRGGGLQGSPSGRADGSLAVQSRSRENAGALGALRLQQLPSLFEPWQRVIEMVMRSRPEPAPRPIDLFGPVANRKILKRFLSLACCLLESYMPLARSFGSFFAGSTLPEAVRIVLSRQTALEANY